MLVLSRKDGQRIRIGPDIWVTLCRAEDGRARIGIQAPRGVSIDREELLPRTPPAVTVEVLEMPPEVAGS